MPIPSTLRISPTSSLNLRSSHIKPQAPLRRMFAATTYRHNQPKTFTNQNKLPRLPVPELAASLEGYLKSLEPVLEAKYGKASLADEIEKRRLIAQDFASPGGIGRVLQERLKDLDHISPHNWLNDTLWLPLAYHTWRAPLLVNSNWWLCFADDPFISSPPPTLSPSSLDYLPSTSQENVVVPNPNPLTDLPAGSQGGGREWLEKGNIDPPVDWNSITKQGWVTPLQIRRAAWIAYRFAILRAKLSKEEVPPDVIKGTMFCMNQYRNMFNLARIPLPNCDAFFAPAPSALHISLIISDFYYSIDIFAPPTSDDGIPEPLPPAQIEQQFQAAVDDAKRRKDSEEESVAIGMLTADGRDDWALNREHLLLLSPNNRSTLASLSQSLLTLTLDTYTLPSLPPPSADPLRLPSVDAHMRNCATGIHGGAGRWWDKPIGVFVETSGRAGMSGEHSPVDALIPSIAVEYVLSEAVDQAEFDRPRQQGLEKGKGWEKLDWTVDERLHDQIRRVRVKNQALIDDSDTSQLWWGEYATQWIKKIAKQSPDAYVQQALQLAWYMDQGYPTATYETASTRTALHGRTDVIRSLTAPSNAFVRSMLNPTSPPTERYALLSTACTTHNALTKRASSGQGYDRHLMGLKVQLRQGEGHALFEDEVYGKSQEWKLSTSGLSAGGKFMGTGFGAGWADGYGINYMAGPHLIKFGIESKFSCDKTSTQRFKHNIVQALRDMRAVCESVVSSTSSEKAKL